MAEAGLTEFEEKSGHRFWKNSDLGAPDQICDRRGDVVLSLCRLCGQAEGELEKECPVSPTTLSPDYLQYTSLPLPSSEGGQQAGLIAENIKRIDEIMEDTILRRHSSEHPNEANPGLPTIDDPILPPPLVGSDFMILRCSMPLLHRPMPTFLTLADIGGPEIHLEKPEPWRNGRTYHFDFRTQKDLPGIFIRVSDFLGNRFSDINATEERMAFFLRRLQDKEEHQHLEPLTFRLSPHTPVQTLVDAVTQILALAHEGDEVVEVSCSVLLEEVRIYGDPL